MPTIASLSIGQKGKIIDFPVDELPLKLLEMGCLPDNEVELLQKAPFNDPLYLKINGSYVSIRKEMAQKIEIQLL